MNEFNIQKWEDSYDLHPCNAVGMYSIEPDELGIDGYINKEWAIAIAKHFKLTDEDLK